MSVFEEVKESVTVKQVASYLSLKFHGSEQGKEGLQHRYACPFCNNPDKHALSINDAKGKFQCFRCKKSGGDTITLVAKLKGITNTDAANELKAQFLHRSTEPGPTKAQAKGRSEPPQGELRPLEILGISDELAKRLHIQEEDGRILFEQRDEHGAKLGTLALATRDDMPLVEWIAEAQEESQPKDLKQLWRVVKGGA
jgi:hypothetical protein